MTTGVSKEATFLEKDLFQNQLTHFSSQLEFSATIS
jgi:hypothetical protein